MNMGARMAAAAVLIVAGALQPALAGRAAPAAGGSLRLAQAGPAAPDPGVPAPPRIAAEISHAITEALRRFEAMDEGGVLGHVSEQYRTGALTKPVVRRQLQAIFGVYQTVQARVRIDAVRMVGDQAWVFSTGEVVGRLHWVGAWTQVLAWERELEVARREQGVWRLYGYQQ
jgi:hypothetical protein